MGMWPAGETRADELMAAAPEELRSRYCARRNLDLTLYSYAAMALGLATFVLYLWGFVEMYCLKGSRKTNRFGPNPLAPIETGPRWEQQSEIEMVPHKGGPPPVWYVKRST